MGGPMLTEEKILASWDRPGHGVHYWLAEHVDEDVVKAASAGRTFACAHLGVPTPAWRFYVPEGRENRKYRQKYGRADWPSFAGPEQNGHADLSAGTIGIRADIPAWLAVEVSTHEVAHLALPGRDRDADEKAATRYGEWASTLLMRRGKLAGVHCHDGFPSERTFAGRSDHGDVLVCDVSGSSWVFVNVGHGMRPRWEKHWESCPVELVGRA